MSALLYADYAQELTSTTLLCHDGHMDVSEMRRQMGDNLRLVLGMKRISQAALARLLQRDAAAINRLANGKQDWTTTDLVTIANELGISDPLSFGRSTEEFVHGVLTDMDPSSGANSQRRTSSCDQTDNRSNIIPFPQVRRPTAVLQRPATVTALSTRHRRPARLIDATSDVNGRYDFGVKYGRHG